MKAWALSPPSVPGCTASPKASACPSDGSATPAGHVSIALRGERRCAPTSRTQALRAFTPLTRRLARTSRAFSLLVADQDQVVVILGDSVPTITCTVRVFAFRGRQPVRRPCSMDVDGQEVLEHFTTVKTQTVASRPSSDSNHWLTSCTLAGRRQMKPCPWSQLISVRRRSCSADSTPSATTLRPSE